jgi:nitrate reductase gamma subunit
MRGMKAWIALLAVAVLFGLVYVGVGLAGQQFLFGVVLPYAAIVVFLVGLVYRVLQWAGVPVPFRITTTCGQQKSLPFIKHDRLENPASGLQAVGRMALEVLLFRSLFRNTRVELTRTQRVVYQSDKWLWAGALVFHWTLLVVLLRHLRFFLEPVPAWILLVEQLDGFFQLTAPAFLFSSALIGASLLYLLGRRLFDPSVRILSLPADYFPLFLLLGIVGSGIFMRYITKTDLLAVKQLSVGLVTLQPVVPESVGLVFYIHLFLVAVLFAYFPFSKLMHLGGVFLSPTRNLANTNRMRRHVNPWNPKVEPHTYRQWEDEFRDKLQAAGIPLDGE